MTPEEMQAEIDRLREQNRQAARAINKLLTENRELRAFVQRSRDFWTDAAVRKILEG